MQTKCWSNLIREKYKKTKRNIANVMAQTGCLCVCAKSSPKRNNNNNNHNNQLGQPAAFDFICLQSALWACIISPTRHCKSRFNAKRRERERQRESGRERALGKLESSLALALSPRSLLAYAIFFLQA